MAKSPKGARLLAFMRDFFVPHRGNSYQPHSLRTKAAIAFLLFVVLAEALLLASVAVRFSSADFLALVLPNAIVSLTNGERTRAGQAPLSTDPALMKAAQAHAEEMAAKGYFAHVSPEGNLPWVWFQQFSYPYQYAGENLAVNFFDSTDVVTAWMNSPTHRDNIVRREFSEIGIGVATGTYEGRVTTFVVQFFGTKKAIAAAPLNPSRSEGSGDRSASQNGLAAPQPTPTPTPISPVSELAASQVQGETTVNSFWPTIKQIVRTAPRVLSNFIFLTLLALFLISFLFAFLIKLRIQYTRIITHGLALIALTFGMLLANDVMFRGDLKVPDAHLNAAVIEAVE